MRVRPREEPLVLFDGDCGFCQRWARRWADRTGGRVEFAPYQQRLREFPEIPRDRFERAIQLVDRDGAVYEGAAAVYRIMAHAPGWSWIWRAYRWVPGFAAVSEGVYRFVALRRGTLLKGPPCPTRKPPTS